MQTPPGKTGSDGPAHPAPRKLWLPNGLEVFYKNREELAMQYREIFEAETYLRHGISCAEGDRVFDVGANIGLFSLFLHYRYCDLRIHAFEPIPELFTILRSNLELHRVAGTAFACGLADAPGTAEFTFYPAITAMSGRYADAAEEREILRAYLANLDPRVLENAEEPLRGMFEQQHVLCPLRTISDLIHELALDRVDLVKIDVEKSELDVLAGIRPGDWPKIRQLVVEVHDRDGRLKQATDLLRGQGYELVVEQAELFRGTPLHTVYASRSGVRQPSGLGSR